MGWWELLLEKRAETMAKKVLSNKYPGKTVTLNLMGAPTHAEPKFRFQVWYNWDRTKGSWASHEDNGPGVIDVPLIDVLKNLK